ncbi:MAG: hypothetical protein EON60_02215 [Alphaproteobacteria bacterium]|nr:MAG: hypothetical protein EON60_02215 [Alphaproteobacteria bacterium]
MATHTQSNTRPQAEDKTERGPGKTDGASTNGMSGKFTSRSGRKSEEALDAKRSTVVSSANKQPGGRNPKGAGAATDPAGTARKGHRIEAARKSRETLH